MTNGMTQSREHFREHALRDLAHVIKSRDGERTDSLDQKSITHGLKSRFWKSGLFYILGKRSFR